MKVVTIGAGIVGAACAYYLSRGGADVTLVDADIPGQGTSGATFAWLNAFRKRPKPYYALNRMSMEEYPSLAAAVGGDAFVHWDGGLHWANTDDAREVLQEHVGRLRSWGYECDFMPVSAVQERHEPGIDFRDVVGDVLRTPEEGWVEVVPLIGRMLAAAKGHGAKVEYPVEVQSMSPRRDGVDVHVHDGRTLRADAVVLTAGPGSKLLADDLGLSLPLEQRPGLLAISRPSVASVKHVVYAPEIHFRPDSGGRVLMGLGSHDRHESSPPSEEQRDVGLKLVDILGKRLPAFQGTELEATRIGVRPIPIDGYPVVGWMSDQVPVYAAVTHSGVTLAPVLGRACAEEILQSRVLPELATFRPGRFVRD